MDRENQWIIEVLNDKLIHMILSNTRDAAKASKVKIRPVLLKEGLMFQETLYLGQKVFHENFSAEEMSERIEKYLQEQFRQLQFAVEMFVAEIPACDLAGEPFFEVLIALGEFHFHGLDAVAPGRRTDGHRAFFGKARLHDGVGGVMREGRGNAFGLVLGRAGDRMRPAGHAEG